MYGAIPVTLPPVVGFASDQPEADSVRERRADDRYRRRHLPCGDSLQCRGRKEDAGRQFSDSLIDACYAVGEYFRLPNDFNVAPANITRVRQTAIETIYGCLEQEWGQTLALWWCAQPSDHRGFGFGLRH